jgi:hypothetical protein
MKSSVIVLLYAAVALPITCAASECRPTSGWTDVRLAFGGANLDRIQQFDYRLEMIESNGHRRSTRYQLLPRTGGLEVPK